MAAAPGPADGPLDPPRRGAPGAGRPHRPGRPALGRPSITQWESIWRIDALLELGRLPEALAERTVLRQNVEAVGLPMSRGHLLRVEAALAQASGRFAEATAWSEQAAELFGRLEEALAGRAMHLGFLVMVHLHTGDDPAFGRDLLAIPHELAPLFLGDLPRMQPIIGHLCLGDLESARSLYDQLAPADRGRPRRSSASTCTSSGCGWPTRLDRPDDLPALLAVIEEHRGVHAGTSAGGVSYMGPVELWLGTGRAALGELDSAVEDLRAALVATSTDGARGLRGAGRRRARHRAGTAGWARRRCGGCGAGRHVAGHRRRPRHGALVGPPR